MRLFSVCLIAMMAWGCETVHVSGDGSGEEYWPVAVWSQLELIEKNQIKRSSKQTAQLIRNVLEDHGIEAKTNGGVSVPHEQTRQAAEVLLTDPRLADSGVMVILFAPAGSGQKTEGGFMVPNIYPDEPMLIEGD